MHNNNDFPPNINPQLSSFIAVIIGAALVDDFSAQEQNAIGNWLMLIAQYIITHASQQNLIESRLNKKNTNNRQYQQDIDYLLEAVKRIYKELEKIKNEN